MRDGSARSQLIFSVIKIKAKKRCLFAVFLVLFEIQKVHNQIKHISKYLIL